MDRTKKIIITVVAVAAAIVVALVAVFSLTTVVKADYMDKISRGRNYLTAGDYDKAVMLFQEAMEMDEERPEAYEGLSEAYDGLGYLVLSQETLEKGVMRTGDPDLRLMLARKFPNSPYVGETKEYIADFINAEPALNLSLLSFVAGATYSDYEHEYDLQLVSSQNKTFIYSIKEIGMELAFSNNGSTNKIDQSTNKPYRENMPDSVSVKPVSYLFGFSGEFPVADIRAMANVREFTELEDRVSFIAEGCRITLFVAKGDMVTAETDNQIVSLKMTGEEEKDDDGQKKLLKGTITDAANGSGVADAKVRVYTGSSEYGTPVETRTGSDGSYSVKVESGDHYITVEKEGYIKGTEKVYVLANATDTWQDVTITQELKNGEIRIVLTWDSTPRDLDSYLRKTTGSREIMTCYRNKTAYDSTHKKIAELDLDDTDGNGPETTTLYDMDGSYEFVVVDYNFTGTMARSHAQVKVYKGNKLIETVDIASDVENMWRVIKIDKGEITVVNEAFVEGTSPGNK